MIAGITSGIGLYFYVQNKDEYYNLKPEDTAAKHARVYDDYKFAANVTLYSAGITGLIYIINWIDLIFVNEPISANPSAYCHRNYFISCSLNPDTVSVIKIGTFF